MPQKIRKERITKEEFHQRGGFSNPALFRQQSRGGAWRYYTLPEAEALIEALGAEMSAEFDKKFLETIMTEEPAFVGSTNFTSERYRK